MMASVVLLKGYVINSEHELGLGETVFATRDLALAHGKRAFVNVGLDAYYESFEEYVEDKLFSVSPVDIVYEEPA
jgi:hypothetical protein